MPEITLNIKLVNEKKSTLLIDSATLVSNLKANVEQLFQVPVSQQKLVFRGRILKNDQTISSYEIQNDSLVVLLKVKPPMPVEAAQTAAPQSTPQQFPQNPFQQHPNNPGMNVNLYLILYLHYNFFIVFSHSNKVSKAFLVLEVLRTRIKLLNYYQILSLSTW